MCLNPRLRQNKKYIPNKKNGGNVPVCHDKRILAVPTKCGECMECRKAVAREWRVRLLEDIRENKNGIMITLTFSNESIKKLAEDEKVIGAEGYERDNKIAKRALRLWNERWRARRGKGGKALRHWLITELGSGKTEHLHLHGIVWTNEGIEEIRKRWGYGNVWSGSYVNEKTVNYCTKYVYKKDSKHPNYKSIVLTSPGIGMAYINRIDAKRNKYTPGKTIETYTTRTGHKIAMPVYWRNKIYKEEEREKLWLEKLDKQERWVDGQKLDISKGEEEYYKTLKAAQKRSKRLGYGDGTGVWKEIQYENERRQLKINERIASAKERPADPAKEASKHKEWQEITQDSTTSGRVEIRSNKFG